eukprot:maker-scaffold_24-snap-gene-4.36-mRNA-1 protein AED:0.05 eAED:0.10 QI:0/0/0/1/0/0/2/0/378
MVKKKIKSKRLTLKDQYKIRKRAVQKHRKERRLAKKRKNGSQLKKDPGIPNLLPYKEKFYEELRKSKQSELDHKKKAMQLRQQIVHAASNSPEQQIPTEKTQSHQISLDKKSSRFVRELNEVIKSADILLYVLDARDPIHSLSGLSKVLDSGKKIVLVLNKIDLIPKNLVDEWLSFLRLTYELPVVAFRAPKSNNYSRMQFDSIGLNQEKGKLSLGAETLIELIKNYSRQGDSKISLTVVSAKAGSTRDLSTVKVDSKLRVIDCPGVLFISNENSLLKVLSGDLDGMEEEELVDLVKVGLNYVDKDEVLVQYRLQDWNSHQQFLHNLAKSLGKLKKGGIGDSYAAAKVFLGDVRSGKMQCFTRPNRENIINKDRMETG